MDRDKPQTSIKTNKNSTKSMVKKVMIILAVIIIISIVVRGIVIKIVQQGLKTCRAELLVYVDYRPVTAAMIMYEDVGIAEGKGVLTLSANEGARLPAGVEIASINLMEDKTDSREQLLKVQSAIDYKNQASEQLLQENGDHVATITERQLMERLQTAIVKHHYFDVSMSITSLDLTTRRSLDVSELGNLMNMSIEELETIKSRLEMEISTSNKRYFTAHGGIVTYVLDGYEDLLPAKDFDNYTYQYITNLKPKEVDVVDQQVVEGTRLFKTIDNFKWYLAVAITDTELWSGFEVGQRLSFSIDGKEVRGKLEILNLNEHNGVAIVGFEDGLESLYRNRFPDTSFIYRKLRAYQLPLETVIQNKDGIEGVYVKEINGIVKFRPVEILNKSADKVYVNIGDANGYLNADTEEPIKTVTMYDEVLMNPTTIKEGQILD